ncbi:Chromatin associated protein KTI12 domain containing protein [Aphelenchoides besseyi]|nr:Chromatin associated protein KTI12 domain containing protein [Aphelenchoides besseyi]
MPFIVITGLPASGKSTIAQRIAESFSGQNVVIVNDREVNSEFKRDASHFLDKKRQVDHMNALRSEVRRVLSLNKNTVVILDSLNYARSQRYEMSTIANNCRTSFGIVWVNSTSETAKWLNDQREDEKYEPGVLDDLIARYEQPKAHLSGEKPLFEICIGRSDVEEDELKTAKIPMDEITEWFLNGRKNIKSKLSTAATQKASCSSVYEINNCTQRIVKQIVEQQNSVGFGSELILEDDIRYKVKKLHTLASLARLRGRFLDMARRGLVTTDDTINRRFVEYLDSVSID